MAEPEEIGLGTTDPRLRLTVIGSAAAWSLRAGRPSSCYLVELGDQAIVLDLGQGSMSHLAERRPLDAILAIVVSHLHPDHHVDLVALRHYLKYGLGRPSALKLHAPPDLRRRYDTFLGEQGFLDALPGDDVRAGSWSVGPFLVEARPVTHSPNAFAFRVSSAASALAPGLVYSGDCGRWQDLVPLIHAGDTLLSEAFWGVVAATADELHLPATHAALAAREGGAARLILTHIADSQDSEQCRAEAGTVYSGPIDLAEPGLSLRIE